jgi:hypothetical protein
MLWLALLASTLLPFPQATPQTATPVRHPHQPPAQVVTGAIASARPAPPLRQLLDDHDWLGLEDALTHTKDPSASFYRGILRNRQGRYAESISLLEPLLPALATGPNRVREKRVRMALADDYFRTFQYQKATAEYAALHRCCSAQLTPANRIAIEIPSKLLPELQSAPPQTLSFTGNFTIPTYRDPLDLNEVSVWVDRHAASWLFDPAASFTMLTRSQAKLIGLHLSAATIIVDSITGSPIPVHATVIQRLKLGDAVFQNVPAVVCNDSDLYDRARQYQIQGVFALPLIAALGKVTITDNQRLYFSQNRPLHVGAPFFSDGQRLIVAEGPAGADRLYAVNPGVVGSLLTVHYYRSHLADFHGERRDLLPVPGQEKPIAAYTAENIHLNFRGFPITLHEIEAFAQPTGLAIDRYYGILGEDSLDQLRSYTFDFRTMRFVPLMHRGQ